MEQLSSQESTILEWLKQQAPATALVPQTPTDAPVPAGPVDAISFDRNNLLEAGRRLSWIPRRILNALDNWDWLNKRLIQSAGVLIEKENMRIAHAILKSVPISIEQSEVDFWKQHQVLPHDKLYIQGRQQVPPQLLEIHQKYEFVKAAVDPKHWLRHFLIHPWQGLQQEKRQEIDSKGWNVSTLYEMLDDKNADNLQSVAQPFISNWSALNRLADQVNNNPRFAQILAYYINAGDAIDEDDLKSIGTFITFQGLCLPSTTDQELINAVISEKERIALM